MQVKLPAALYGTFLWFAPVLLAQSGMDKPQAQANTQDASTKEAVRQGRAAFDFTASRSPNQTMEQAIAFERYKDQAAAMEARKEAGHSYEDHSADRSAERTSPDSKIGDPGPRRVPEK